MISTPGVTPMNACQKDFADEIKITNWLTLNWRDYPGNIITWAFKRRKQKSLWDAGETEIRDSKYEKDLAFNSWLEMEGAMNYIKYIGSRSWKWLLAKIQQGNGDLSLWLRGTKFCQQPVKNPERDSPPGSPDKKLGKPVYTSTQQNCDIINGCFKLLNLW